MRLVQEQLIERGDTKIELTFSEMVGLFRQPADPHRHVGRANRRTSITYPTTILAKDSAKACEAAQQRASDVLQRDTQCPLWVLAV